MKDLLIYCNMGLGDAIIVNGLVRKLAETRGKVIFLCKSHNCASIQWMFQDNPRILVEPVAGDTGAEIFIGDVEVAAARTTNPWDIEIMRLGCTGPGWKGSVDFDRQFYDQAGVPFEQRWEGFHVERSPGEINKEWQDYAFIHDDPERGFVIPTKSYIEYRVAGEPKVANIFRHRAMFERATEVHVIPSSFLHLIDSLPTISHQKLYLHKYTRPGITYPERRKNWTILE